jgi:hypothetical protein
VITLTPQAKRVFQTVGRNGLPEGKALRLVRAGHTKDGAPRVGITVGEPKVTDRPVIHEGSAVAWVSSRVMDAYDGCVLGLEEEVPEGVGVVSGTPHSRGKGRSHRHGGWGAGVSGNRGGLR